MCRKGRMFAPTKIWRRWHRRVNVDQKRFAVASAVAASAVPALVLARGHRVEKVPELPLVVSSSVLDSLTKTKAASKTLQSLGAWADVEKVLDSKTIRAGQGKARNRKWVYKRGPLVVHAGASSTLIKSIRNIKGVDAVHVQRLNLLQLAPGAHVGRFIIWTEDAFKQLDTIWGTSRNGSSSKKDYVLPRPQLNDADVLRVTRSEAVKAVLKAKRHQPRSFFRHNPLKNANARARINPYSAQQRRESFLATKKTLETKVASLAAKKDAKHAASPAAKTARKAQKSTRTSYSKWSKNIQ